jgi:pyruvate kinase
MTVETRRRAKIVCTLGPASRDATRALIDAGMDVARLNFSHGTQAEHATAIERVRAAADAAGRAVAVLADLQGPRIRLGAFAGAAAVLEPGEEFVLTTREVQGDSRRATTTHAALPREVRPRDTLLIADGAVRLEVVAVEGTEVRCRVIEGGTISDHRGINLPGVRVSAPPLTPKDEGDLRFALARGVDWVALSFVRSPADADVARRVMSEAGSVVPLIAKLERPEAVEALEQVIAAFDGVMVARGDLGVELALERVPMIQKRAIQLARQHARPVIVATEMLESMVRSARPTRAEVSDVANAVLDGADALMLSAETSIGAHPIESAAAMARIISATEAAAGGFPHLACPSDTPPEGVALAAARLAADVGARALVAFTETGRTARLLARHRGAVPIVAFTSSDRVRRELALVWGVESVVTPRVSDTDSMVAEMDRAMLATGRGAASDLVAIVAGTPPGTPGSTNTIRLHRLGGARRG